jgi:NitT/TauT family transport system permease protein
MTDMALPTPADTPAPIRRKRRRLSRSKVFRRVLPWLVVAAMFLLWQLFVDGLKIEPFVLPSPSAGNGAGRSSTMPGKPS